jgi:hypothetical protein
VKPTATRTLNPLPFQDLEPHRFEDLVRQLAYDFRQWKSLEATGRSGSDDGIDIRGIEIFRPKEAEPQDEPVPEQALEERLWIFQCKRERSFAASRVRSAVSESITGSSPTPHGFVLAIAADVSKKTRDAFRQEMVARGVSEFAIWSKGELEDMLFQPANDRLLFAYFGLSLQQRRRSLATSVRSQIALKKQLASLFDHQHEGRVVLLRDPSDERYPREPAAAEPQARWLACRAVHLKKPHHLVVLHREHLAATTPDGKGWDAILDYDLAREMVDNELRIANAWDRDERDRFASSPRDFWEEYIPESDRAYVKVYRSVPLARILAVDPLGDGYYPVPHVLVEFDPADGPFTPSKYATIERAALYGGAVLVDPEQETRRTLFPTPLPKDGDPAPAGFDHTSKKTSPLTPATSARLRELVERQEGAAAPVAKPAEDRAAAVREKMLAFQKWREQVATPLLSSFVVQLRKAGHSARLVIRSVAREPGQREAFESIELRVRLFRPTVFNPNYRPSGQIRLSLSELGGWAIDVYPPPATRDGSRPAVPQPKPDGMTAEQLEGAVLTMLERVRSS